MADSHSLESLQELHADLLAYSESRLLNVDRLESQLQAHVEAFKALLDKKPRNEQSRKIVKPTENPPEQGSIEIDGVNYSVNPQFREDVLQVAQTLELDELDAAQLFLEAQDDSNASGQPVETSAVVRFHQRRKELLDCLRMLIEMSLEGTRDDIDNDWMEGIITKIVRAPDGKDSSRFTRRCLTSMVDIRTWLVNVQDRITGLVENTEENAQKYENFTHQQTSLTREHELLGIIVFHLTKRSAVLSDFHLLIKTLRTMKVFDQLLLHLTPALFANIYQFGGPESGSTNVEDARELNIQLMQSSPDKPWEQPCLHAAVRAWWLSEYSGWYGDNYEGLMPQNQLAEEGNQRSRQFAEALKDGAFDFMISVSADVKEEWYDPARTGLRLWLQQRKAIPAQGLNEATFSEEFQEILMDQLQRFAENFILNMPNVLRKLRTEEDEQRQMSATHEQELEMERFLVILSYVFEGRPKAALEAFWDNPDGGFMGFIYWVSTRASTPLISAFCEMIQAISQDEDCATSAHEFLVDEGPQKTRRLALTWNQMIKELTYFSNSIRNRPAQPQIFNMGKPSAENAEIEPETFVMLEEYLRLIARIVATSPVARAFFILHPTFHLIDILLQLASSQIGPRIRAAAFTALRSMLGDKTKVAGEVIWTDLDAWVSGGHSPGSNMTNNSTQGFISASSPNRILRGLSNGFEEPNALVQLLTALISPYAAENALNDGLAFPENLGSATRMPGIEPYIDYVLDQIFGSNYAEINAKQLRMLQLSCLEFIAVSLDTFNEDLVVFANRTNIDVEHAMHATDLRTYVVLHPFGRVMEWMFNERVMAALFAIIHQDASIVGNATRDSPLMRCVLRAIHVVSRILDLQATYLDIVRPLLRVQSGNQRKNVFSAAYSCFEDGILKNLPIIADLGLYCGAGQPELVLASLELLQKISASTKLASSTITGIGRLANLNKAIAVLELNNNSETIARSLLHEMKERIDPNQGADHSAFQIQEHILDFLYDCLKAAPGQPTIAHLLLGFQCTNNMIDVEPDSPFSNGVSLFHCILELVMLGPFTAADIPDISSYLMILKNKAIQVLGQLWQSPLSSAIVIDAMRNMRSIFVMFASQIQINDDLFVGGRSIQDPVLFESLSASIFSQYLNYRAILLQYVSSELRQVSQSHLPSLKSKIIDTLLGSTEEDGERIEHISVFELFDFIELGVPQEVDADLPPWISDVDLTICIETPQGTATPIYSIAKLTQLLILRKMELHKGNMLDDPQDMITVDNDIELIRIHFARDNQTKLYCASRLKLLQSWAQMMLVMIDTHSFVGPQKTQFMLQILQTILPSLESRLDNVEESMELARLAKSLLFALEFESESFKQGDMRDAVSDRLFQLFQVSLRAISSLGAHPELKEVFYTISYRYLAGMGDITGISKNSRRHSIQTIKAAGERFVDLVCDDAHSGEPMCRISALLLLGSFVKMAEKEESKYVVESLGRMNFVAILVESIQHFASDLHETHHNDVILQLSYCHARLSLLLQIAQTRLGATAVLNAGIFHSIQASGLFAADPDLGVDIDIPDAVSKHYDLLTALMRVTCAVVLSRGSQNAQTLDIGRRFLTENRLSIMAVLKKSAGIGAQSDVVGGSIGELADSYMVLMSITGYIDLHENTPKKSSVRAFT
ncbi:nucleoporin Nup186/Nup192/Nup205 [Calycina marina]|uniref:Nucleoporin Nup186/Nup192/Nup205 n=1 Tax=Calycina marina TaxID=1763456 RepID=A0A9P7Z4X0_9HELO|nr:nucleoporin Nup186/Nup192/Nup205 [Calycina marina]